MYPEFNHEESSEVNVDNNDTDPLTAMGLQNLSLDEIPISESTRLVDVLPEKPIGRVHNCSIALKTCIGWYTCIIHIYM